MPISTSRVTGKTMVCRLLLPAGLAVCLMTFSPASRGADEASSPTAGPSLAEEQKIVHVLNRLGYGAMRLCAQPGNFGPYPDWEGGKRLLRRAVELG